MCLQRLVFFLLLGVLPSEALAAEPPGVELAVSDEALTAMLAAACPIEQTIDSAAAGLPGVAQLAVVLTEPSVHVTNAAVKVSLRYHARDKSGALDLRGVAKPDLKLVVKPDKGLIEGRLTRVAIVLPGGAEIPLDASLAAFSVPAVWSTPLDMNSKTVTAQITVTEIVPETGRAILRGEVAFKPRRADSKK